VVGIEKEPGATENAFETEEEVRRGWHIDQILGGLHEANNRGLPDQGPIRCPLIKELEPARSDTAKWG
jgi:hypothetical protein